MNIDERKELEQEIINLARGPARFVGEYSEIEPKNGVVTLPASVWHTLMFECRLLKQAMDRLTREDLGI